MSSEKPKTNCSVIILAAGKGTRMHSDTPKVLHKIAGKAMLAHVVEAAKALEPDALVVVLAPHMDAVKAEIQKIYPSCLFAIQEEQKGTGHAVACGMELLKGAEGDVLVAYGDTPLVRGETFAALLSEKQRHAATIALAGIYLENPTGYGRLVMKSEPYVECIVECKDASAEQKKIRWGWGGVMAFDAAFLHDGLKRLAPSPATGEYYLTALLELATAKGEKNLMVEMSVTEAMGVNDRVQLAEAEAALQARLREAAMKKGVTLVAPDTVFLATDTQFGRDVVVHPHVVFGSGVVVGDRVEIKSFSHVEQAAIGAGSVVGPYARLRPGASLAENVHIGNFVEIKKSNIAKGAKINHLSYVGDAEVGAGANIGAGTITCNYDGTNKYQTVIEEGAFIGSNTSLVAPVKVGAGAIIGAGSVITEDVPADALSFERSEQTTKPERAKIMREAK
jgi:bifunctional UDP-N-acetylglucosamine pyrophosphorylase/glucosamine-1-phosphate N-acetyltransferase